MKYPNLNRIFNLLLVLGVILNASQNAKAGTTYGEASDIFSVGAGARAMGMGGAFTGLADDGSAPYYNPAGLAYLDEHQLMIMHAPLYVDSSYNYFSTAHPMGDKWGSLALSGSLLLSNNIEERDNFNVLTSKGSSQQNTFFGSYAHKLTQKVSVGVNGKYIQQKLIDTSAGTFGLDAGVLFKPLHFVSLGASFANINTPKVTLDSVADVYRPVSRMGVAIDTFRNKFTLTADVIKVGREDKRYAAGAEFSPSRFFSLRGGFGENRDYTFGLGANLKPFRIDYAFSNTDLGAFNKVSITWAWHNIYQTEIEPPMKEGHAIYPLGGFENQVVFKTDIPSQTVARWTLQIKDQEGKEVRTLQGDLRPPEKIFWDAKNTIGEPVVDGHYAYDFQVMYKNGKFWENQGDLKLDLPDHDQKEVIDMSLQLNGAKGTELTAQQPSSGSDMPSATPMAAPVAPVADQPTPAAAPAATDQNATPAPAEPAQEATPQ